MPRTTLFKAVLLLVLVLFLAVPSLQAAEPRRDAEPIWSTWDWLAQAWEFLISAWGENGCLIEPDGRCLPRQNPTAESENGCEVDPNGCSRPRQSPPAESDNGCRVDPDGCQP